MFTKRYKIPIYGGILKVIISTDPTFSDVNKKFGTKACDDYSAYCFIDYKLTGDYTIVIPPGASNSDIAHESFHITNMVFGYIGAKPNVNNDEPQAYFLGWVIKQVDNALEKYKKIDEKL
jgi:hypothetical protein